MMLKPRNLILIVAFIFAPHSFAKNDENTPKTETKAKVDLSGLSTEEISIYQQGKITDGQHIAGGLVGTFIGFGTGHIEVRVKGKYTYNGVTQEYDGFASDHFSERRSSRPVLGIYVKE